MKQTCLNSLPIEEKQERHEFFSQNKTSNPTIKNTNYLLMKTKLLLFFVVLLLSSASHGYNNLRINNPQTWQQYNAVIDDAELTVRPVGAFVEYGLTLTISGLQPIYDSPDTQLEIVLDFDLPSNSMITDSWLWIEGEPKRADILDRWTASAIYEEIVNRRKDPSLLVKNGANQYSINIYPMKTKESRKFKIVYLSPAKTSDNNLSIEIPSPIFNLSTTKLEKINTYFLPTEFYGGPTSENNGIIFTSLNHVVYGNCIKAEIPNSAFNSHKIKLENTNQEKVKIYQYGDENEGFYQLSFKPSELIELSNNTQKICYLVDFDKNYTQQDLTTFLNQLSSNIMSSISEKDEFNIIFSNISPTPEFDDWVPATPSKIQEAFSNPNVTQYSNFISLLGKGIDFINTHGSEGKLVLVTNNCAYNNIESANDLLADIYKINVNKTKIDVIDYAVNYYWGTWASNTSYYNNAYLFTNLTRKYSGELLQFYSTNNGSNFYSLLENAISQTAGKTLTNIDIYTSNEQGFCYGRMNISNSFNTSFSFGKNIHHIGRYKGGFPTSLEIAFEMEGQLFHHNADLTNLTVSEGDSVIKTIWSGLDMFELEKQGYSNQIIGEIINQSIDNRILSNYTAFLCVEDPIEVCEDCGEIDVNNPDDGWSTSVDEKDQKSQIKAYPNPFSTLLQIELPINEELVELKIYNASGQCIKTFVVVDDQYSYSWDGTSDNGATVKDGIYLIKATYKKRVATMKIMKK